MANKPNMTVAVTVMCSIAKDPDGQWKATATYSGVSVPPALPGRTVVGPDGQIDLTAIDRKNDVYKKIYANDTNIFFYLGVHWPHAACFPFDENNKSGAGQAIVIDDDSDKGDYAAVLLNPWALMLVDTDQSGDQPEYTLKVAVDLTGNGEVVILDIDPIVINRGGGN